MSKIIYNLTGIIRVFGMIAVFFFLIAIFVKYQVHLAQSHEVTWANQPDITQ